MLLIIIHGVVDERVVHQAAAPARDEAKRASVHTLPYRYPKERKALFAPPAAKRRYLSYSRLPTGPLPRKFLPYGFTATGKQQADTGQQYVGKPFRHSDRDPNFRQRYIIFGSPGDSPIFLSVSSIPFPARIRKPYLCKQTKGLSMLQLKEMTY